MPLLNFKEELISLNRPNPKSAYSMHDCLSLKHLFELRVGLRPLPSFIFICVSRFALCFFSFLIVPT